MPKDTLFQMLADPSFAKNIYKKQVFNALADLSFFQDIVYHFNICLSAPCGVKGGALLAQLTCLFITKEIHSCCLFQRTKQGLLHASKPKKRAPVTKHTTTYEETSVTISKTISNMASTNHPSCVTISNDHVGIKRRYTSRGHQWKTSKAPNVQSTYNKAMGSTNHPNEGFPHHVWVPSTKGSY